MRMKMKFLMPNGMLEIRPSRELSEDENKYDNEIEGVSWKLFWDNKIIPWHADTRYDAYAIALGCQYGAFQMYERSKL